MNWWAVLLRQVGLSHRGGSSREDARQRCSRVIILAGKPPKSTRMPWSSFSAWKSSSPDFQGVQRGQVLLAPYLDDQHLHPCCISLHIS